MKTSTYYQFFWFFNFLAHCAVSACEIFLDDWAFGLSRRRVTVSSSGIVPALLRMSDKVPVSLAISLHAPEDELRDILVPINKKYPIKELMKESIKESMNPFRKSITFLKHSMKFIALLKEFNELLKKCDGLHCFA